MTDRKKPGWVFWTTVVVVVPPVLYIASFVVAVCLCEMGLSPKGKIVVAVFDWLYDPIFWAMKETGFKL